LNHGEQFTVTDLWDRTNSDGFVKVRLISVLLLFLSLLSYCPGCQYRHTYCRSPPL
jgi:hypothetical protein